MPVVSFNLDWDSVKELQIVPRAGYFDAVWVTMALRAILAFKIQNSKIGYD